MKVRELLRYVELPKAMKGSRVVVQPKYSDLSVKHEEYLEIIRFKDNGCIDEKLFKSNRRKRSAKKRLYGLSNDSFSINDALNFSIGAVSMSEGMYPSLEIYVKDVQVCLK